MAVWGLQQLKYAAIGVCGGVMISFMVSHYYPALDDTFARDLALLKDDEAREKVVSTHADKMIRLTGVVTAIRSSSVCPFFILQLASAGNGTPLQAGVALAEKEHLWRAGTPEEATIESVDGWSYTLRKGQEVNVTCKLDSFRGMLRIREAFIID